MSIRNVQQNTLFSKHIQPKSNYYAPSFNAWTRNPSWTQLPSVTSAEQKFVGLHAVFPDSNFVALTVAGAYTVDWGDGTAPQNYTTGSTAYYQYDYNSSGLDNTNGPVTFTASTSTVNRTSHGYSNNSTISFDTITTTTGINTGQIYYVVNATNNTFQVSDTIGGSFLTLTNDGSGNILPYKQAIITVTPQSGQNITSLNLFVKHNQTNLRTYASGWLDITLSGPNLTASGLTISGSSTTTIFHNYLERCSLLNIGNLTSMSSMFNNCTALQSVSFSNTAAVTNMSSMFNACYSLQTVPLFNTAAVTNMTSMFSSCYSLQTVPLFNTAAVTNMTSMFASCYSLQSVPLFNTSRVINMLSMFNGCRELLTVPAFNTSNTSNLLTMFTSCISLQSVPTLFANSAINGVANTFSALGQLTNIGIANVRTSMNISYCKLSSNAINTIFTNLGTITSQTITTTGNWGAANSNTTIATNKGWTVTG